MRSTPLAAIALLCILTASTPLTAQAEPGDLVRLERHRLPFVGPDMAGRVARTMDDLESIVRYFEPASMTVKRKEFEPKGPRGKPRMILEGSANLGPLAVNATLNGDITVSEIRCPAPNVPRGYRFTMDMTESSETIRNNASAVVGDLCFRESDDPETDAGGQSTDRPIPGWVGTFTTYMKEGPGYGFPVGPEAKKFLAKQSLPLFRAMKRTYSDK